MRRTLATLTLNQKLAAAAFVLGAVAVFAQPSPGGTVSIDSRELAAIVQTEADHVVPEDLADWIVQGRADYRLIDVRDARAFADYHIPGAENVTVAALPDAGLARNEKIVLYSEEGVHAAQAWVLLKAGGYRGVYTLRGGLDAWRDQVLFPRLVENPTPFQAQRDQKIAALARHFGGEPLVGGAARETPALAPVAMPSLPVVPVSPSSSDRGKRKKKEGC